MNRMISQQQTVSVQLETCCGVTGIQDVHIAVYDTPTLYTIDSLNQSTFWAMFSGLCYHV